MVKITRRYDVNAGVPLSVTARITWAVPGEFGVSVATPVLALATVTRGVATPRPPGGAEGTPVARPAQDPGVAAGAAPPWPPPRRPPPGLGMPLPASA